MTEWKRLTSGEIISHLVDEIWLPKDDDRIIVGVDVANPTIGVAYSVQDPAPPAGSLWSIVFGNAPPVSTWVSSISMTFGYPEKPTDAERIHTLEATCREMHARIRELERDQ